MFFVADNFCHSASSGFVIRFYLKGRWAVEACRIVLVREVDSFVSLSKGPAAVIVRIWATPHFGMSIRAGGAISTLLSLVIWLCCGVSGAQEADLHWRSWSEPSRGFSLEIPSFFEEERRDQASQVVVAWRRQAEPGVSSTFPTLTVTEHSGSIRGLKPTEFASQVVSDYRKIGIADVLVDRSFALPFESGGGDILGVLISYTWEGRPYLTTVAGVDGGNRYFLVTYIDETSTFEQLAKVRERVINSLRVRSGASHGGGIPQLIDEEDGASIDSSFLGFSPELFSSLKVYFVKPPYVGWIVLAAILLMGLRANKKREQ